MSRQKSKSGEGATETPLMKQYNSFKAKYPDAILLFRVGDFYETFGSDAVKASQILGIVLTKRANGSASEIELAGFPHHSLESYLPRLVRAGNRVAICDQLEDPKLTKTIVKRGVTELVTPGVSYSDKTHDQPSNRFLCALLPGTDLFGIALLDISTGEFYMAQGSSDYADKLIQHWKPSEIIYPKPHRQSVINLAGNRAFTFAIDEWVFTETYGREMLQKHFNTSSLKGFGIEDMPQGIIAAGACLHYLEETMHLQVGHISAVSRIDEGQTVWLDRFTIRNLELIQPTSENGTSLLNTIDFTLSPMGGRLIARWIGMPLKDIKLILERQDVVTYFLNQPALADEVRELCARLGDPERAIARLSTARIQPRELLALADSSKKIDEIARLCAGSGQKTLMKLASQIPSSQELSSKIYKYINPDAPAVLNKGNVIAKGNNDELDQLREIAYSGKDYLMKIQISEAEKTGISSLKVAYNAVFGYYLEVTNTHKDKVPSNWIRKQTLTNAERYITPELKEYEEKILGAEEKISVIEQKIYSELLSELQIHTQAVQKGARMTAAIDCLQGFAKLAYSNDYTRPEITSEPVLDIKDGRHPVIEKLLPPGEKYIPNDLYLDNSKQQILMITGPNMSGKSAVLRQAALIVILAQMGSYVPATHARIGITDKIFTRVGASDNLSAGESTFMVEMNETASILNNLSDHSLILLDEIGRGTSTYDGISIAWSIAEFLHEHPRFKPRTLFATHYHELNEMAEKFPRIRNFHVSVKESESKVLFLRKLVEGGSEHSFGIHVAKMAGMPRKVVDRAEQMLKHLEKIHRDGKGNKKDAKDTSNEVQLSFFKLDDPALEAIREELLKTDINTLTPVEALMKLNEIKKMTGG